MTVRSISTGFRLAARRPGLALLVYLANLLVALVISIPVFGALSVATGRTGYGPELVERFNFVLWSDIIQKSGDAMLASWAQFLWTIPLVLLWKIAMSVGLVHALRDGGIRSFWEGVGRYTGKAALLALLYLVLLAAWLIGVGVFVFIGRLVLTTSPATFVLYWIVAPMAIVLGLALMDAMHDYGRISLVSKNQGAVTAWFAGIAYPFRHPVAILVYLFWAVVAIALSAAALQLHPSWGGAMVSIWLLFLGQQVVFLLRSATTVAWFGSEVSFFQRIDLRDAPRIADAPAAGDDLSFRTA
jgi:hypothetical protein